MFKDNKKAYLVAVGVSLLVSLLFIYISVSTNAERLPQESKYLISNTVWTQDEDKPQTGVTKLVPPTPESIQAHISKVLGNLDPPYNLKEIKSPQSYFFPNINIFFTGIPKTGCSNWEEALLSAEGALQKDIDPKHVSAVHGGVIRPYRMNNYDRTSDVVNSAISIAVLRNPWTRAVSGYRQKLSSEKVQGGMLRSLSYKIVQSIRPSDDDNPDPLCTFEEFVQYSVKVGGIGDRHFKTQLSYLNADIMRHDEIIPLEYANKMAGELFDRLHKNISLFKSYDKTTDPRQQSSALKAKEWLLELQSKNPKLISDFYQIYKDDFDLLNYSNFTHPEFPLPLL